MAFYTDSLVHKFIKNADSRQYLLVLVHGRGGRWELMEWFAKRAAHIESLDFLCVQAPHPEFVPEMKVPGFSWYIGESQQGLEESRQRLKQLVDELRLAGYVPEKTFWLGFSQGGVISLDLALRSDQKIGAAICVSGFCLAHQEYPAAFGTAALSQTLLATHGLRDEIVPFEKAKESYEWLMKCGAALEFRQYNKPHSFDLKEEIPFLLGRIEHWVQS